MRLARITNKSRVGFNLTPMIDIVFLLIIFFIAVSQITPLVNFPVQLPQVPTRADPPRLVPATINIDQAGSYIVAGQRWNLPQVELWLDDLVSDSSARQQQLQVLIRADRSVSSEHVHRLLPKLAELGIREIKFSVSGTSGTKK